MTQQEFIKLLKERGDAVYIVDRGLIAFAKFAAAVLAMFTLVGVFFFGFDIKKTSEEAKQAQLETKKTLVELNETKAQLILAKQQLNDSGKLVAEARNDLQKYLDDAKNSSKRMLGIEQEALSVKLRIVQLGTQIGDSGGAAAIVASSKTDHPVTSLPSDKPVHVGVVSEVKEVTMAKLRRVVAALQQQVTRDFGPIWSVSATVEAYEKLEDVPKGYWPMIIKRDIGTPRVAGIHSDEDGQPFALVSYDTASNWTATASHELLDMLADPFGNRTIAGPSPNPADKGKIINVLVEVAQPVEGEENDYEIDGVRVSDFVTPAFFGVTKKKGSQYSLRGAVKEPLKIAKGGFLSWGDNKGEWYQAIWFDTKQPVIRELGKLSP